MPISVRKKIGWLLDHPFVVLLVAGAVVLTIWAVNTRRQPHHVRAVFESALNLIPGQSVKVDGLEAGKISKVSYSDGRAVVEVGVFDKYWPLHAGTTLVERWGTTIGSGTRRLDMNLGRADAPTIPEGGLIEQKDTTSAVDVDQVLNTFSPAERSRVQSLQRQLDETLSPASPGLRAGLRATPEAVAAAQGVFSDMQKDTLALRGLVANGDRLTNAMATRRAAVSGLVTVAARTFEALGNNADGIGRSIDNLPSTLDAARSTLGRLDTSVGHLDRLMVDLRPGVGQLTPLATTAQTAVADLHDTVPAADALVSRVTRSAPALTRLFTQGRPFVKDLAPTMTDLAPMMACIRPYAPEAGGAVIGMGGWDQGYVLKPSGTVESTLSGDPARAEGREVNGMIRQHYGRAIAQASTTSDHAQTLTPAQFAAISGKQYAMPRPPGLSANQPWFMPQCGITKDALDPSKDPETGR